MAGRNFDQINYPTNITNPATFAVLLRAIEELGSVHSSEASKSVFPKARAAVGRFNAENNDTHGEGTLKTYGLIEYVTTTGDAEFKVSYLGKRLLELYEKNDDGKYVLKAGCEYAYKSLLVDCLLHWSDNSGKKTVFPGMLLLKLLSDERIDEYITDYEWTYICAESDYRDTRDYDKIITDILEFRKNDENTNLKNGYVFLVAFSSAWGLLERETVDGQNHFKFNDTTKDIVKYHIKRISSNVCNENNVNYSSVVSTQDDDEMSVDVLGEILADMYNTATNKPAAIHMFGIKYGKIIEDNKYSLSAIVTAAGIASSYEKEVRKGVNIYLAIVNNEFGVSFADESDRKGNSDTPKILPLCTANTRRIQPFNRILYGAPGTGKTYSTALYALSIIEGKEIKDLAKESRDDIMARYNVLVKKEQIVFTTFHQSYGYEDFIQGIRPDTSSGDMKFKTVDGVFKKIASAAMDSPKDDFVIIIDEINRANISKVFGELITLIETDKRWGEENALSVTLPSGEPFAVPNNLYIIGTMNSADKSISLIDTALRRRFEFVEFVPNLDLVEDTTLRGVLEKLNRNISKELHSTDLLVGHSFFIGRTQNELCDVMNHHIIPLLYEYFFDNKNKVEAQLTKALEDTNVSIIANTFGRITIQEKED